jgi:hypothetical protein
MSRKVESQIMQVKSQAVSNIPIPYGCMGIIGIVLTVLALLAISSFAVGMAILK